MIVYKFKYKEVILKMGQLHEDYAITDPRKRALHSSVKLVTLCPTYNIKVELKCLLEQIHGVRVNFRFNQIIIDDVTIIFSKVYPLLL